jgi:TetR/AcrR family transcriptional regulator, fatty acid metabolism regulator protein
MAKEKSDPIQEQLIQARRDQILGAAIQVFAEKGFQRATIRDVAKAAGIADGTIYNYFENKTALIMGILNRMNETEHRDEDLGQAVGMDLREFFKTYIGKRYTYMTEEGLDILRAILPEVLVNPELREAYMEQIIMPTFALSEKHFAKLVEDGTIRPVDVPLTLRLISSTFLGLMLLRMMGDPVVENQWDDLAEAVVSMTLDGLSEKKD